MRTYEQSWNRRCGFLFCCVREDRHQVMCMRACKYACIVNVSEETITDNVRVCNPWVQCACVRGIHRQVRYACN